MFKVIGTSVNLKKINTWFKVEKESAEKISPQLKDNPFAYQPLRYPFLREKRVKEKRVYYLVALSSGTKREMHIDSMGKRWNMIK